jgi:hypothetical protein
MRPGGYRTLRRGGHPRGHHVRDQARTRGADDRPGAGGRDTGGLGGRRRGLRRRPRVTSQPGKAADRIRAGGGQEPHRGHQRRAGPGGRTGREAAAPVLAAAVSRGRCQGAPLVRLGAGRHRARPPRPSLAADPPQPAHPGSGLSPLLVTTPGAAARAGARGRNPLEPRRELRRRQGAWPAWTNIRSGAGPRGTGGPPSPCSPWHSSLWPPRPSTPSPRRPG